MLSVPNGAELFVGALKELGIERIFTLVGDHLNEVLAQAKRGGISIIDMRHESGVTHAADAWARITRRPALALVTGGPGHTNAITGIATAQLAGSPLIAVSGSRASTMGERQAFQDIDQVAMTKPLVKWAAQPPTAALIPFYLRRAYTEANFGRKGAVHLTIPVDLFTGLVNAPTPTPMPTCASTPGPAEALVKEALDLLNAAERPVVIAGSGVWWSGAEDALRDFVEASSLPLYTITMARGLVADDHPLSMGYADTALNRAVRHAFPEADVCLVVGKRIDFRLAFGGPRVFSPRAKFIQIDIHPQEFGMNRAVDVAIYADAKLTLEKLTAGAQALMWNTSAWLERLRRLRAEADEQLFLNEQPTGPELPIHPSALFQALKKLLPRNTLYSWDGGDFVHWGRAIMPALALGGWLRLGPLATIGAALPNAVALKLAHPNDPVVMITGDGALGFYIAELDTLVRHGLPVVIIVGNDGGWGLERELQSESGETVACELRRTRYDIVMQGFGGGGENIERLEEMGPALARVRVRVALFVERKYSGRTLSFYGVEHRRTQMSTVAPQYLTDASGYPGFADQVYTPVDEAEVVAILRSGTPITIAGAGSGLTGARVPQGGAVLSLEKFRKLEIGNGSARVGPAVTLLEIRDSAATSRQFFAPDPTEITASIGGAIATNASGSRSFRYGSTRRHVLALRVALMDGSVREFRRGDKIDFRVTAVPVPNTRKNTAGYLLTPEMEWIDLFCGSEGTLGVVLEAEIALLPVPRELFAGVIFFPSDEHALAAVDAWRAVPELRMLEYVDRNSLDLLLGRYPEIPASAFAALLIEAEGDEVDEWETRLSAAGALLEASWFATTPRDRERFRAFRHSLPELVIETVVRRGFLKMGTDYAVPLERGRDMLAFYRARLEEKLPGRYVIYGHIGDAHVHVNMLPGNKEEASAASALLEEFARQAVLLGGTVSAEHGLGKRKAKFLSLQYRPENIQAMKDVKSRLDPQWLLGRGTIFAI